MSIRLIFVVCNGRAKPILTKHHPQLSNIEYPSKKKQNLSNDPRALMFLALIFLLQLELNSLSGKLELKWMSPWSTSIDTWRVKWVGGLKDCGQDILQKAELHLLVLHMFSQQVHDLLTVASIQETLQGCSSYVEAAWEDQERRWRRTRSTLSENPHPGENWEGEKDCQSQSCDTASFPRPATSCHLKRSKNPLSLEATWALDINSKLPRHIKCHHSLNTCIDPFLSC